MTVKAIIFDLDDTLLWDEKCVEETFAAVCQMAANETGADPVRLEEAVREEARELYATYDFYSFTKNIGINPFEGLWGNFNDPHHESFARMRDTVPHYRTDAWTGGLKRLGIDNPELGKRLGEAFPAERRKRSIVYDDTYDVLEQLKGKYKLMLLTNGSPELQQEKLNAEPRLKQYFDHIVISGEFGQGKPSKALYTHVLQLLGIEPEQGMMVGDKLTTDIKGANGIGLTAVWINRHGLALTDEGRPDHVITSLSELMTLL